MSLVKRFLLINPLVLLSLCIILFILRMACPYVNYVFIPYLFLYSILIALHYFSFHRSLNSLRLIFSQIPLIIITLFFIIGILLSVNYIFSIVKDLLSAFILIFLCISFSLFVKNLETFIRFSEIFRRQFIIFSAIVCITGLIKFYYQLRGYDFPFLHLLNQIEGTSLNIDYNFYILFIIVGIISIFFELKNVSKKFVFLNKTVLSILLFIYSLNVLFSYSRRGFIILIILICVSVIIAIKTYNSNHEIFLFLSKYLVSVLIFIILFIGFTFILPIQIKKNTLKMLGISTSSYKYYSSIFLYRYSTIVMKVDYHKIQQIVWTEKPDPRNPDSGWGVRRSTMVFPLKGENSEIVPKDAIGYKMDSTSNASTWSNRAYSYSNISSLFQGGSITKANEFFYASVYCYVSKDFNGTWARISTEGNVSGKIKQEYNLTKKGEWQKLNIVFQNSENISPVYLYWCKDSVTDFVNLRGYVIFAYPEYKIITTDPKDPETWPTSRIYNPVFPLQGKNVEICPVNTIGYKMDNNSDALTWRNNAYSYTNISFLFQGDLDTVNVKNFTSTVYCFVSDDFTGSWVRISAEGGAIGNIIHEYDLTKRGTWQKLQISFKCDSGIPPVYLYWCKYGVKNFSTLKGYIIFAYPEYFIKPVI